MKYQICKDETGIYHIIEEYNFICSKPRGRLKSELIEYKLKALKELVQNSDNFCFMCSNNIKNH